MFDKRDTSPTHFIFSVSVIEHILSKEKLIFSFFLCDSLSYVFSSFLFFVFFYKPCVFVYIRFSNILQVPQIYIIKRPLVYFFLGFINSWHLSWTLHLFLLRPLSSCNESFDLIQEMLLLMVLVPNTRIQLPRPHEPW